MAARRREPQRTCLGCRRVRPKNELVRLALVDGRVIADRQGRAPGRGAYVCPGSECMTRARARAATALRAQGARWSVEELV